MLKCCSCFNAVALLFILQLDEWISAQWLSGNVLRHVENFGRAEVGETEDQFLVTTKRSHAGLVALSILVGTITSGKLIGSTFWLQGFSLMIFATGAALEMRATLFPGHARTIVFGIVVGQVWYIFSRWGIVKPLNMLLFDSSGGH